MGVWSAPFHPAILASVGNTPKWVRAEQPPEVDTLDGSLVVIPNVSLSKIPKEWWDTVRSSGAGDHRGPLGPRQDRSRPSSSGSIPIPAPPRWTPATPTPTWSPIFWPWDSAIFRSS